MNKQPLFIARPLIIAIDGPAASGKGTLARKIAVHYGLAHLDTGLTYRAVAQIMLQHGAALDDERQALMLTGEVDWSRLDADILRQHDVGEAASKIATLPMLRQVMVAMQRQFVSLHSQGAVLDGRDIGTVVLPQAHAKLFVTASPEIRAERRYQEIITKGGTADFAAILADLSRRDVRDKERKEGALKQASDAYLLETTKLTIEAAFAQSCHFIDGKLGRA